MVEHHLEINHVMQILFIFNEYDATIKKLYDIKISNKGYKLNGTLINANLSRSSSVYCIQIIQLNDMVYIQEVGTDSSGNISIHYTSETLSILLYI